MNRLLMIYLCKKQRNVFGESHATVNSGLNAVGNADCVVNTLLNVDIL
ncbi:MAG: hypothetical protein ACXWT3_10285 [Methylococcaceae bacterium]